MVIDKKIIFLVDDEPTNLFVGRAALEDHYDVLTLNSGAGLLKAIKKTMPDLIILDIDMPEMDGFEAIRLLKDNPKTVNIPVIFLTGRNDDGSKAKGLYLGAVDFLHKPFDPLHLIECIGAVLFG